MQTLAHTHRYERKPFGTLRGHTDAVTCVAVDGNFIVSGSDDATIRVWDGNHGFQVRSRFVCAVVCELLCVCVAVIAFF
jgi:WD40 repeat protein